MANRISTVIPTVIPRLLVVLPLLMVATPGYPKNAPLPHRGPWPIQHWHDLQPTQKELRALHIQDMTPQEARRVRELYWELEGMRTYGSESCDSFAIAPSDRARCRASLARHPYLQPSRPVPMIEAR